MRWPAYSLMLLAPPPSRAGRLLRLTAPVRPVREFRHLISSSGPYRVGSSCRRPPEREARVRGPSRHANLTRAGRGTIACASPTCRLDADDVECRRVPSTLAVRSASAGTSRSVPRRATLQSYNPQAEPRERLRWCGDCASLPIRNNRREHPVHRNPARQEASLTGVAAQCSNDPMRHGSRRQCTGVRGAASARPQSFGCLQPQGTTLGEFASTAATQVSCESSRPPATFVNSPRASLRTVSLFSVSFLVSRRSDFLIGVR